ncbi:hypothetical protein ACFWY9_31780 [Amycolatopsis sp. NPDC059027]|uniref:hypothetical protein n=1 Tax=unclassified Amycolatopsis TaxID=2618356 RepID=UPI003670D8D1
MTGTAEVRRGIALPALGPVEATLPVPAPAHAGRFRGPRPWAAPLPRPAARILLAGGLTLAGWLLGAALSNSAASADDVPGSPGDTAVATPASSSASHADAHATRPHRQHRSPADSPATSPTTPSTGSSTTDTASEESGSGRSIAARSTSASGQVVAQRHTAVSTAPQPPSEPAASAPPSPAAGSSTPDPDSARTAERQSPATSTPEAADTQPAADTPQAQPRQGPGLLGGLVGGLVGLVGDTLGGVVDTITGAVGTVLPPLASPPTAPSCEPGPIVRAPLDDILDPVFSGGGTSGSGTVTATRPAIQITVPGEARPIVALPAALPAAPATPAAGSSQYPATSDPAPRASGWHQETPAATATAPDRPRDSGTHARTDGGGGGGGLPGAPNAPVVAPSTSISTSHDSAGGTRQPLAVHTDEATVTQLRLIGVSRDHAADGAGREAALPATSPD